MTPSANDEGRPLGTFNPCENVDAIPSGARDGMEAHADTRGHHAVGRPRAERSVGISRSGLGLAGHSGSIGTHNGILQRRRRRPRAHQTTSIPSEFDVCGGSPDAAVNLDYGAVGGRSVASSDAAAEIGADGVSAQSGSLCTRCGAAVYSHNALESILCHGCETATRSHTRFQYCCSSCGAHISTSLRPPADGICDVCQDDANSIDD